MEARSARAGGRVARAPSDGPPSAVPRWVGGVLAVPLFWKLLLANVTLLGLATVVVVIVVEPGDIPGLWLVASASVASIVLVTLVHAALVRLALRPLDRLTDTARRITGGEWASRAPHSVLADTRLERLRAVFNAMLDAVSASHRKQRDLARRVLSAEEQERERIAHELYAGTAQTLAGVLVRLRVLARLGPDEPNGAAVDEVANEVRAALEEIRKVARRLRPPELDELGVRAALEAHARGLTQGGQPRVEFLGRIPEDRLPDEARLALFRIVQEAVTNAVHHGRASQVRIQFLRSADGLVTEVQDDGRGFDPAEAEHRSGPGFGLTGMDERAAYAGGSLEIDTAPGHGTRIRVVLPWAPGETPEGPDPSDRAWESLLPAGAPT